MERLILDIVVWKNLPILLKESEHDFTIPDKIRLKVSRSIAKEKPLKVKICHL